jgi:hypothetical protein
MKEKSIMEQFNLPSYTKGKSFAEASKAISDKFKDRNDPESKSTHDELQGRLQEAQEHVKSKMQAASAPSSPEEGGAGAPAPEQAPMHNMPDGSQMPGEQHEEYAYGGSLPTEKGQLSAAQHLNMLAGGGPMYGAHINDFDPNKGIGYRTATEDIARGNTGLGLEQFQGNTSLTSPSSITPPPGLNKTEGLETALDGAGEKAGPGAGAVVAAAGTALSLGKKAFGPTGIDTSGNTAAPEVPGAGMAAATGAIEGASAGAAFGPWGAAIGGGIGAIAGGIGGKKAKNDAMEAQRNVSYKDHRIATSDYKMGGLLDQNQFLVGGDLDEYGNPIQERQMGFVEGFGAPMSNALPKETNDNAYYAGEADKKAASDKSILDNAKKSYNSGELLRYAPVVANAAQLLGLKKPGEERLDRMGNKYEESRFDEQAMQNLVKEDVAGNRNAILSSSGGSGSTARANLLASQYKGTQAISDGYLKGTAINAGEREKAQKFDMSVDQINIGQSNAEKDINAKNKGAYQSQKSALIAQLGQDLGGIGQEELFKKYPELMGLDYNSKGQFSAKLLADKVKAAELKAAKKKAKESKKA